MDASKTIINPKQHFTHLVLFTMVFFVALSFLGYNETNAATDEAKKALSAYNDLLSKSSFDKNLGTGYNEEIWYAKNCKFCLAYITDDDIPELLVYNTIDGQHSTGYGIMYSYYYDGEIGVSSYATDFLASEIGETTGYYERTGWYMTFGMWQGYGDLCTGKFGTDYILSKRYEPSNNGAPTLQGYYCTSEYGWDEISKDTYYATIADETKGKQLTPYNFYQNTSANREKYLETKEETHIGYIDCFKNVNEIGNTYGNIRSKYSLRLNNITDSWMLYENTRNSHLFAFHSSNYLGDSNWGDPLDSDICYRMSGTADEMIGITDSIGVYDFIMDTDIVLENGIGHDLDAQRGFIGQFEWKGKTYWLQLRDNYSGNTIDPDDIIDVYCDAYMQPSTPDDPKEFKLGRDNNSFAHSKSSVVDNAGFIDVNSYKIDDSYFKKLTKNCSKSEISKMKKKMNNRKFIFFKTWDGSCYGIAATMGLVFNDYLKLSEIDSSGASYYYNMDYPYRNNKLLNAINYYQLSQYLSVGGQDYAAEECSYNTYFSGGMNNWNTGSSLKTLLKELVKKASAGEVFELCYSTQNYGHAILVSGYNYEKSTGQHVVYLYDENSASTLSKDGSNTHYGYYSSIRIPEDYSGFEMEANGEKITEKSYRSLRFLNWNKMIDLNGNLQAHNSSAHTNIEFSLDYDFTITNEAGKHITCKDGLLSGDMNVYGASHVVEGESRHFSIETNDSENYIVNDIEKEIDIEISDPDGFMSVSADQVDSAIIHPGDDIEINGDLYRFTIFSSTNNEVDNGEDGLISVTGYSNNEIRMTVENDSLSFTTPGTLSSVETSNYIGTAVDKTNIDGPVSELIVKDRKIKKCLGSADISGRLFDYTGEAITPSVLWVRDTEGNLLTEGVDYVVSYYDNYSIGGGTVLVTGIGEYSGSIYLFFEIIKKPKIGKGKIKSIKAGKKKATIKIGKIKNAIEYEIAYKKAGGSYKRFDTGYKTETIKRLKSKKTYYFKVRGIFYDEQGRTFYGKWSKVKKVKIK